VILKEAPLPRQGSANVRGDIQESSQANLVGTSPQHRVKSSIHQEGPGAYTRRLRTERRVFTPGDLPCATGSRVRRKLAEDRVTGSYFKGEVSRGHSSPVNELGEEKSREVADWMKARTVPPAERWG
jgi:hypothetical protein